MPILIPSPGQSAGRAGRFPANHDTNDTTMSYNHNISNQRPGISLDTDSNQQADIHGHLNRQRLELNRLEERMTALVQRLGPVLQAPGTQQGSPLTTQVAARTPLGIDIAANNERLEMLNIGMEALLENLGL